LEKSGGFNGFGGILRQKTIDRVQAEKPWELPLNLDLMPTQSAFMFDFKNRFTAYGGGLANGKSTALIVRAWLLSTMFPGNTGYLARYDGKELRQTTLAEFKRIIPDSFIEKKNDQLGYMKFKAKYGGSEIIYGDLKEERFNNLNLGWFCIDQAEEIDEGRWNLLVSRLRKRTVLYGPSKTPLTDANGHQLEAQTYGFLAFNPEGTSSYIWRFFHPDSPEKKEGYQLYEASTYDGLAANIISQDYVDSMLAVFPEQARKRYLDGAWDVFEGRIYPLFAADTHVLREPIRVQPHWKLYESIDHGLQNPTAVGWWAVDEHDNRFLLDEHYEGGGKAVSYHAAAIKGKRSQFPHAPALTYLDSHCWARDQSRGEHVFSIADEYTANGIYCVPGQKDWGSAYMRITQSLLIDPAHRHPVTGLLGAPHLYVAAHCTNYIREMLGYRWKKNRIISQKNTPDKPMDYMDHHMDAHAYFEASRPSMPVIDTEVKRDVLALIQERARRYDPFNEPANHSGSWMSV
jgi:hypothetical protein